MVIKGRETPDKNINNDDDQEAIIKVTQQETVIQKDTIRENIDKMHPLRKFKQGKQQQIIRFNTDSFKDIVYCRQKNGMKVKQNQQRGKTNVVTRPNRVKFKPSLTKRKIELLEYADAEEKDIKAVQFVYADVGGNLKMFNEPIN